MPETPESIGLALREMGTQILMIAQQLAPLTPVEVTRCQLARAARTIYNRRRQRDTWFAEACLGEPAWDLLLDLFASEAEGRPVSVTSACIAASVPPTTGLRHVEAMEKSGLIERTPAADDRRVVYVNLTADARLRMAAYLSQHAGDLVA